MVKFESEVHRTEGLLDCIHADIWGPTKTASLGSRRWFVTFVDDFSRRCWVYTIHHEHQVIEVFMDSKNKVENQIARKIKVLRFDNGCAFSFDHFLKICQSEGITRHFNVQQTPQQIERQSIWITFLWRRCDVYCPMPVWVEAVNYACHLVNRLPSSTLNGKCPLEVWSGKPSQIIIP